MYCYGLRSPEVAISKSFKKLQGAAASKLWTSCVSLQRSKSLGCLKPVAIFQASENGVEHVAAGSPESVKE